MTKIVFDKEALEEALRSINVVMLYKNGLHGLPEVRFMNDLAEGEKGEARYPIPYYIEKPVEVKRAKPKLFRLKE